MSKNETADKGRDPVSNTEVFPAPVLFRTPGPQWASPDAASNDVAESGDLSRYLHALRRRWLIAVVAAVPLSVIAACAVWFFQAQAYTATAILRLASTENTLLFETAGKSNSNSFDLYKRTQRQWMKSRFVFTRALRDTGDLAQISVLRKLPDPVDWLEANLNVTFPDESEVMHVSLAGESPEGLDRLVNAVVKAYFDEIVTEEKEQKRERLNGLELAYKSADAELRSKRNDLRLLVERVGTGDLTSLTLVQQNSLNLFAAFQQHYTKVRFELLQAEGELQAAEKAPDADISLSDHDLLLAMNTDREAGKIRAEKQSVVDHMEKTKVRVKKTAAAAMLEEHDRRLQTLDEKLAARKSALEPELIEHKRQFAAAAIDSLKDRIQLLQVQEDQLKKRSGELEADAKQIGKSSIDVEMMRHEIAAVQDVMGRLSSELQRTQVETQSDARTGWARVTLKSEAPPARTVAPKARLVKTLGAGVVSLFLPMAFIVWLDARKRRINSRADVELGLGLSVIGSVPLIPQRVMRRLDGSSAREQYWQTLLSESVDSIAAVLLRGADSGSSRMVMVSSANSGEGKTTLAAHLATSLAGAGCRTVLVDFDLRRPALHRVLGLSLQPGVAELLRDKPQFESAVQATQIPNLMFIAAGRSNGSGLGGLANADLKCLFDQLRAGFEFVVVDGSPILPVVDTRLIAQHVDAVVLSVLRDVSCTPQLRAACQLLGVFGVPILGVVVTGSRGDVYQSPYEPHSEVQPV